MMSIFIFNNINHLNGLLNISYFVFWHLIFQIWWYILNYSCFLIRFSYLFFSGWAKCFLKSCETMTGTDFIPLYNNLPFCFVFSIFRVQIESFYFEKVIKLIPECQKKRENNNCKIFICAIFKSLFKAY